MTEDDRPPELPAVAALRALSIFGADQGGAYREHFHAIAQALGDDVRTKLAAHAIEWAESSRPGVLVLTGNAGTGKTAVCEAFCKAAGGALPKDDAPADIAGRLVIKDLSGLASEERAPAVSRALEAAEQRQVLVCANEGVLRDVADELHSDVLHGLLEEALRQGAARNSFATVVNVNRQRPTAPALWGELVEFVAREELWEPGCAGCPGDGDGGSGCPMRANAAALRASAPREAMRLLVQLGAGESVPTMREVLAILSWAIVGGATCEQIKRDARDRALNAHTAEDAYFHRALGGGLPRDIAERSPLLLGMQRSGLGETADLEVDEWLRDSLRGPTEIQALAGAPPDGVASGHRLSSSRSPHDRVRTVLGCLTFSELGETLSTSEDPDEVEACLEALVGANGEPPRQALWRRRVFFEAPDAVGGQSVAVARLLDSGSLADFLHLAEDVANGKDVVVRLGELVGGLNFLVCGFSSSAEGLIVPDQACLFARDPGSFRPARPSLVHGQIPVASLELRAPDHGLVGELVDVDHLEIDLVPFADSRLALRIRPRLFELIREAALFRGPVGQGVAEMTDVRGFFGRLAAHIESTDDVLRVADPQASPPSLQALTLPHTG